MTALDLGVLFRTDPLPGDAFVAYAHRLEEIGVESVWVAELFGREPFVAAGALLGATTSLRVGTAIANIYARDATATAAAAATLAELSGNRFELGLGVSNRGLNEMRGHTWQPPAPLMADYLDGVKGAAIGVPDNRYRVHVAAHGPKMLAAAAARADGVFTYLMNPSHTARTVAAVAAADAPTTVTPMMMCLHCTDPTEGRRLVRKAIGMYVGLDYYHRAWRTLGFDDDDFTGGGSDRLLDAVVAWGSIDDIRERLQQQSDAGASRVVVIPLNAAGGGQPDWELLEGLAA